MRNRGGCRTAGRALRSPGYRVGDEIDDTGAITYATGLYASISNGHSVNSAPMAGKTVVELAGGEYELPLVAVGGVRVAFGAGAFCAGTVGAGGVCRGACSTRMTAPMSHSAKATDAMPPLQKPDRQSIDRVGRPGRPPRQGTRLLGDPRRDGDQQIAADQPGDREDLPRHAERTDGVRVGGELVRPCRERARQIRVRYR